MLSLSHTLQFLQINETPEMNSRAHDRLQVDAVCGCNARSLQQLMQDRGETIRLGRTVLVVR
jgi:hypothetical protein